MTKKISGHDALEQKEGIERKSDTENIAMGVKFEEVDETGQVDDRYTMV